MTYDVNPFLTYDINLMALTSKNVVSKQLLLVCNNGIAIFFLDILFNEKDFQRFFIINLINENFHIFRILCIIFTSSSQQYKEIRS